MSEGRKDDQGKVRIELFPGDALFAISDILTSGAKKYTWEYETEWDRLLDVSSVISVKLSTAKENVVVATKGGLGKVILSTPNGSDKTVGIGRNEILTKLRGTPNVGKLIQKLVNETLGQSSWAVLESSDLPKKPTQSSAKTGALFADQENIYTLTIVTTQGDLEVYFVLDATTASDFWTIVWKDLKEQFSILKPQNQTGDRNWEKGMDWSRVFGALMRHMWAWWQGKGPTNENFVFGSLDEETKRSHLWHGGCCIVFLIAYEMRGVGTDDRPS